MTIWFIHTPRKKGRTDLPELFLGAEDNDYAVPVKDIEMEAGKPYREEAEGQGGSEKGAHEESGWEVNRHPSPLWGGVRGPNCSSAPRTTTTRCP
jgi:hypothetical protein